MVHRNLLWIGNRAAQPPRPRAELAGAEKVSASMLSMFERTFIVNLPKRVDRRRHILAELARIDVRLQPGRVELFPAIRPTSDGGFPSIGALGCFLSHRTIIKQAVADKLENVLIVEDDLKFIHDIKRRLPVVVDSLFSKDWQFAYLGHVEPDLVSQSPLWEVPYNRGFSCSHFYALHRSLMPDLLDFLEGVERRPPGSPDGGPMHVDGAFSFFRSIHPNIRTYAAVPALGGQASSRSDITIGWPDRIPGLRPAISLARSARSFVRARIQ